MRFFITLIILSTVGVLALCSCSEPEPIRIGFLGELTGHSAGLSSSGRDGFLLAIEEINAKGGINGHEVLGLVQDLRMQQEDAIQAVRFLQAQGVQAIIGPMTSQAAVAIVPEINRAKIPTISPTVSTNQLAELDDYFFRTYYTNAQAAELLAGKLLSTTPQRIAAILDLSNQAYTVDWLEHFQKALEKGGGTLVAKVPFDVRTETKFLEISRQTAAAQPDSILILASAVDTALICQQFAKIGVTLPRYATGWSYSDDLIQMGGQTVEGLTLIQSTYMEDSSLKMQQFVTAYLKRFRNQPNFPALHAYDATRLLLAALEKTVKGQNLRQSLLDMSHFEGLQSDLAFDRYGDQKNPQLYLARIENGAFVPVD